MLSIGGVCYALAHETKTTSLIGINQWIQANVWGTIFVLSAPFFIVFYFILAYKSTIQYTVYLLWKNNLGDYLTTKIQDILDKTVAVKEVKTPQSIVRKQLIEEAKKDRESNFWQRKSIQFVLEQIHLHDIDFVNDKEKLKQIIPLRLKEFISNLVKPSLGSVYLLFGTQITLIILIYFFG